jgi:hypothetical protein
MSTASSMGRVFYRTGAAVLALLAVLPAAGCKKRGAALLEDPDEKGKLARISARLDEAYANTNLPNLREPASLSDRLDKWDDFRSCTVRTYVARKRDYDRALREGRERPKRHASIGDETVEECAVEMAVVNKDPAMCERLQFDFIGANGEMPLSAVRCWDTRARVLGLPEECPVVWMPEGFPARNPECLALARRDQSLCPFAESAGRCRALLTGDSASCGATDGAPDCQLALEYWRGLIPAGVGAPLVDPTVFRDGDKALSATFDLSWDSKEHPRMRVQGPRGGCGISWPAGKARPAWTEDTTKLWGGNLPVEATQIGWRTGQPAIKLAFAPAGASSGTRPLQPPGPTAAATFIAVWTDPQSYLRCLPGPGTTGEVQFDAGAAQPGSFVTGKMTAKRLACSDGSVMNAEATFRLVILDVR